ncbi:DnaD domain protein [Clostridium sp. ATCC 25772]|uniref:DnaD domain protein n=1 Tax=Clostridium sp. ATCC 25772 TaxID=1676991 RepID=UPI000781543B|nr:DnaD domain protein [Clostridium sp. ATCC 25772]
MLYMLNFNEKEALELNVNLDDILILSYLKENYKNFICKTFNNTDFYWINYENIICTLPILNIKKDTLYRKLKKLCSSNILIHKVVRGGGTYSFYAFGDNFYKIFDTNSNKNINNHIEDTVNDNILKSNINPMSSDLNSTATQNLSNNTDFDSNSNGLFLNLAKDKSELVGIFKELFENNSLTKDIYNILNNIVMLFNNIKSINRFYNCSNSNNNNNINYSLDMDFNSTNSEIYSYYSESGFGILNKTVISLLDKLVDENNITDVKDAMTEAVKKGNTNICYVEGILRNWKNKTEKTAYNISSKANFSSSKSKDSFNNFKQRNYDFDELEKDLLAHSDDVFETMAANCNTSFNF